MRCANASPCLMTNRLFIMYSAWFAVFDASRFPVIALESAKSKTPNDRGSSSRTTGQIDTAELRVLHVKRPADRAALRSESRPAKVDADHPVGTEMVAARLSYPVHSPTGPVERVCILPWPLPTPAGRANSISPLMLSIASRIASASSRRGLARQRKELFGS